MIINETQYNEKYLVFHNKGYSNQYRPTAECFIHVWQKSSNSGDFKKKMRAVWEYQVENNFDKSITNRSWHETPESVIKTGLYVNNNRAKTYREKGVELKELPRAPHVGSSLDYEALNALAQESLNESACTLCGQV